MPVLRCAAATFALLLGVAAGSPALAADKVAVMVFGVERGHEPLADQCSEVLLAATARTHPEGVVGKEEFLVHQGLTQLRQVEACVRDLACMARAQAGLGLSRIVLGYLGGDAKTYRLQLMRYSTRGAIEAQAQREFPHDPALVLAGLGALLEELHAGLDVPVRIDSNVAGAQVYLDDRPMGSTPLLLPRMRAGLYTLRVEAPGHEIHRQALEVGEAGAQVRVTLIDRAAGFADDPPGPEAAADPLDPAPSDPAPASRRTLHWPSLGLAGGATLLLAAGGVAHALAWKDAQRYAESSDSDTRDTLEQRGRLRWKLALVGYGAGLALAGTAATVYLLRDSGSPTGLTLGPALLGLSWAGQF